MSTTRRVDPLAELKPGHYVTTDFLKNNGCVVIAGPFPTQDEARDHRTDLEDREGHHNYFLEQVRQANQ